MKYIKKFNTQEILNDELLELLGCCSNKSSLQKIKELISKGADVNCRDTYNRTPLMKSACYQFYEAVDLLINYGADVNAVDDNNQNALIFIVTRSIRNLKEHVFNIIDLLINSGADISHKDNDGDDIFHTYDEKSNKKLIKYISDKFPKEYEEYLFKQNIEKYNL